MIKRLPEEVKAFFQNQGCVIVSTVDSRGFPHSSCKGIVKIGPGRRIYLLDLYRARTFVNLEQHPQISISAIDEHDFVGYCLKGRAKIIPLQELKSPLIKAWEERITSRITRRLLKNIREEKGHPRHPEALMPKPQYLIAVEIEEIVDLTPHNLKGEV